MVLTAPSYQADNATPRISHVGERETGSAYAADTDGSVQLSRFITGFISREDIPAPQELTSWQEERKNEERVSSTEFTGIGPQYFEGAPKHYPTPTQGFSRLDDHATRILRAHFSKRMLDDLIQIQRHCSASGAACYADSLLRTMRAMADLSPADPYLAAVMALHDAMAFENSWIGFTAPQQYAGAYQILKSLANEKNLTDEKVERAIIELEGLGLDTTPFSAGIPLADSDEISVTSD